ncbi:MAG: phosphoenolpyruvate synthase [Gammaproteobacteria bacterium]|nr:phosphoenolpyruvate synthase [Gammaproteobacteria bacterium]
MRYTRRFNELNIGDIPLVGGKNASLGEMYNALAGHGIHVPNGFAITADGYRNFIEHNQLGDKVRNELARLQVDDTHALNRSGARIREWISNGEMPSGLVDEVVALYRELEAEYGEEVDVAVRSSATAEDLPTASFAGQQDTYLNIRGIRNLLATCRQVFASLFTDRAISYRHHQGFDHLDVALSIGVQKMARADHGCSGVMFTLDTESGFRDVVFITAAYGLGENIVQGKVNPDEFYVFKPTLARGFRPILKRQRGDKAIKMIYTHDAVAGMSTRNVRVQREDRERFAISDDEVLELARIAVVIEQHYSQQAGTDRPMDIEWAKDGKSGQLFIVQARPETVQVNRSATTQQIYSLKTRGEVIATGKSVGKKIASGRARVILEASQMHELQRGEVLVTDITDPDWEPVMKLASALVTNRGGRTCHAAIIARELGIPAVVGCETATHAITNGQAITVSCAEGDTGLVFNGQLPIDIKEINLRLTHKPATKIMLNIGNPEQAFEASQLPADGVGLARLEFIINNSIRIHPRALLEYAQQDEATRHQIDAIWAGYPDPQSFYIKRLAEGVGTIAAAFFPRPVIVRMGDFKSNEYASLIGGARYEPAEENPMIGFRGAGRYFSPSFAEAFRLECAAMKRAREYMGLDNIALMIPFVRTVDEGVNVLRLMEKEGLRRGDNGLKIYMMCEIPSNALLADAFLEHFDGFSIGSNDLTQLTLGADRDSGLITGFDERNPAVKMLVEMAIKACKRHNKYIGICGQAPSDYPELTAWLVEQGIESISLNPDSVLPMIQVVIEEEKRLAHTRSR